ncbi:MAG: tetratricopeptide repeat protein [Cyclobacteriaceae bacterium]
MCAQKSLDQTSDELEFREGLALLQKEKYAAARDLFESYLSSDQNTLNRTEAEYFKAYSALNLFHTDGEFLVEQFVTNHPDHPKSLLAYYELGDFYFRNKKYDKSIGYFEKVDVNRIEPAKRVETNFKLAYAYFGKKQFDQALGRFNQLKRTENRYTAAANYYAGFIEYRNGDYDQALLDLQKAERNEAYAAIVPYMIANVYYKQKQYDQLIEYSESVVARGNAKNVDDIYLLAGEAYYMKGDYNKAAEYFENYAKKQGKRPAREISYKLAYAQYAIGETEKAKNNFKSMAASNDEIGQLASYYLGEIYVKENNLVYSKTSFEQARKGDFNASVKEEATFNLGKVNYDTENYSEAVVVLQEFLEQYPESSHANEVNDLISEAYLRTNDYNQAIQHIESLPNKSDKIKQTYQKVTYFKGTEFFNNGKYYNSVKMFEKSLQYPVDSKLVSLAHFWSAEAYSIGKKYPEAINSYASVFQTIGDEREDKHLKSRYGIGYAYYNTKQYDKAMGHFQAYTQALEATPNKWFYKDALIRLADCYYVSKSYGQALGLYDKAIRLKGGDLDYAYFQKGVIAGIQGNTQSAKANLNTVLKSYPNSRYVDNALFQTAQLDLEQGNYQTAIAGFGKLISSKPESSFVPHAYTKRAVANYNLQNYDAAARDYKQVLDNYVTHESANSALIGLQETLNVMGRSNEFDAYLAKYKKANPENQSLANIEYESAKNLYFSEKYQSAIEKLETYQQNYPGSAQAYEAKYFIAESYYKLNQVDRALDYYEQVVNDNRIAQVNRALKKLGEITFQNKNYREAIKYYGRLAEVARSKKDSYNAWSGLMECHYLLRDYEDVDRYARLILEQANVNANAENRSLLYLGKSSYERSDFESASDYFLQTLNTAKDEHGAEAQYLLADIQHQKKEYTQSNETLYDLNAKFGAYDFWLGRSFLLISDNYVGLDEIFQAKATLNSVIENSPNEMVVEEAKRKLAALEGNEARQPEDEIETDADNFQLIDN